MNTNIHTRVNLKKREKIIIQNDFETKLPTRFVKKEAGFLRDWRKTKLNMKEEREDWVNQRLNRKIDWIIKLECGLKTQTNSGKVIGYVNSILTCGNQKLVFKAKTTGTRDGGGKERKKKQTKPSRAKKPSMKQRVYVWRRNIDIFILPFSLLIPKTHNKERE